MDKPTILLTGATGNTGQVVAEQLRARHVSFVAMARSERNRSKLEASGITAIAGDFDDRSTLERALAGIEKAYLVCTPDEHIVRRETEFIHAAKAAGVRHVVKCSAFSAAPYAITQNLRSHGLIERELIDSGLDYTIVRPHGFMQTFTLFAWNTIEKADVVSVPAGDGGIPLIDVRDVATVAVLALTEPGHAGKSYDLTGPAVLNMYEQAKILGRVLGRPITYVPGSERQLTMIMKVLGVPEVPGEHVIKVFRLQREHAMEHTTPTLRQLGIEPIHYEQFVRDFIAGRTGGGNSFEPPQTLLVRALDRLMPPLMRTYVRVRGRR